MNPYWGVNFFQFFAVLLSRLWQVATGHALTLTADEVQIGVLGLTALSCGLVGPFLVLKRMAMFANSLSHTVLLGIALSFLIASSLWGGEIVDLSTLFLGAFVSALLTAFFTESLVRFFRLQEDASIGLVFTALFALGIVVVSLYTRNVHLGIEVVMGNVDALQMQDLRLSATLAALNLFSILLFYRRFLIVSFDAHFAKVLGISLRFFHFFLLFLSAVTILGAFRAIGVVLVLSFLVGPYLTARLFSNRLFSLLFWTPAVGIFASLIGVALSRHLLTVYGLALSTGGIVVCVIGGLYILALLLARIKLFTAAAKSDNLGPNYGI